MAFNQATYDELKKIFEDTVRITRINQYKEELVSAYNNFVEFVQLHFDSFSPESKDSISKKVASYKLRILRSLVVLGLKTDLPDKFGKIDVNKVIDENTLEDDATQIFFNASSIASNSQINHSVPQNLTNSALNSTSNIPIDIPSSIEIMPLSLEAILSGITDFSSQNQAHVTQFIANAQMMVTLAPDQAETVLTVIRTRLATASALGDISNKTWNEIKASISERYIRSDIPFETAQERLLAIKQGSPE